MSTLTGTITIPNVQLTLDQLIAVIRQLEPDAQRQIARLFQDDRVVVEEKSPRFTAKQLLESELIGLWQDRDLGDSVAYARALREQGQRRPQINGIFDDGSLWISRR